MEEYSSYTKHMKKFILLSLACFSFSSFAQDYSCYVSTFKLSFKADDMMSELVVRDRQTGEFIYSGFVDTVQNFGNQTQYHFGKFRMTFKAKDMENAPERFSGFADGTFGRGFYNTTLPCIKQ